MEKPPTRTIPPPNPITTRRHHCESLEQIILPFVGAVILISGLAFLLGKATSFNTAQGANIALIGLILSTMFFGLLFFAIIIGLIIGLTRLFRILTAQHPPAAGFLYSGSSTDQAGSGWQCGAASSSASVVSSSATVATWRLSLNLISTGS